MEEQAVHGVRWTFLAYLTSRLLGLVGTVVLAHLLLPRDFGVVALALVTIEAASYVTGLGLAPALVMRQDLTDDQLGTALSLLVLTNAGAAVALGCAAPAFGVILHDTRVVPVLLALAATGLVGGVSSFYDSLLQRRLLFRPLSVAHMVQSSSTVLVALALAAAGAGVWSLVLGRVAGYLLLLAVLVAGAPFHVRPRWERQVVHSLLRSGRGFLLQSLFSFIEQNADYAVVGRALGAQALGVYSMGFRIGELPYESVVQPVADVTFPGFARMQERGEWLDGPFLALLRLTSICVVPLAMVIAGTAHPAVQAVLGRKWAPVATVLPVLGVWGCVHALTGTVGWFVSSVGHAARLGRAYGGLVIVSVPVLVVAVPHFGIRAAAFTMLGNSLVALAIGGSIATRRVGIPWRRQWDAVRPAFLAAVPTAATGAAVSAALHREAAGLTTALAGAAAAAVYVIVIWVQDGTILPSTVKQLRRIARGAARTPAVPPVVDALQLEAPADSDAGADVGADER